LVGKEHEELKLKIESITKIMTLWKHLTLAIRKAMRIFL
jgi:hypothetical protein